MLRTVTRDPAPTAYRLAGGEHPQPVDGEVVEVQEGPTGRVFVRARLGFPFFRDEWFGYDRVSRLRALSPRLPEVEDTLHAEDSFAVAERRHYADAPTRAWLHHDDREDRRELAGHLFPPAATHDVEPLAPASMARYL